MNTASFDGVDFNGVERIEVVNRSPPLMQVSVFCPESADNPLPDTVGAEGFLSVFAPDQNGQMIEFKDKHAVYKGRVPRSYGPGQPRMTQFTFVI